MSLIQDLIARFGRTVTAYAGDDALMQAGVSAASNVIVADGEVAGDEFDTALQGIRAQAIVAKGYDLLMLEDALYEAIGRARTRVGRVENLRRVGAILGRPIEQRQDVFLIAADVADHDGVSPVEDRALAEIAAALGVDKAGMLAAGPARAAPSPA